jgi:hypothetical protein
MEVQDIHWYLKGRSLPRRASRSREYPKLIQ